jgi:hypothetical protein
MKIEVDVSLDEVLDGCFAIVATDEEHGAWVAHIPGETPCICDSLTDAVGVLRDAIKKIPKGQWHR